MAVLEHTKVAGQDKALRWRAIRGCIGWLGEKCRPEAGGHPRQRKNIGLRLAFPGLHPFVEGLRRRHILVSQGTPPLFGGDVEHYKLS